MEKHVSLGHPWPAAARWRRAIGWLRLPLMIACLGWRPGGAAATDGALSIWFMPAGNSPDTAELFANPQSWPAERAKIDVIGFGPAALQQKGEGPALFTQLVQADAFRRIRSWGIGTAIEVPAIKEWDCSGQQALRETLALMRPVLANGGSIDALAMDEPLISAFGMNKPVCRLDIDVAAERVARYARSIEERSADANRKAPDIVDVEAYPSLDVKTLRDWIGALRAHGFKPAALHLDPNYRFIENHPAIRQKLASDLAELQRFLKVEGIPFGIIVWPGSDPVPTDEAYYEQSMKWVRVIHAAIGRPDRVIFESWVTRCSHTGDCAGPRRGCRDSDPTYCGSGSVPLNFSSAPSQPGHLQLIHDASAVLLGR